MIDKENADLERLKKTWKGMGVSLGPQGPVDNLDELRDKKTALDRLKAKYGRFSILSLVMLFVIWQVLFHADILESRWNFPLAIAFTVYFAVTFIMDRYLACGLGTIDPLTMSVAQVMEKSLHYRKRHLQFMALLIPMAMGVLSFFAYAFSEDSSILMGMISGAVVGGIAGYRQFRKMMSYYRTLAS